MIPYLQCMYKSQQIFPNLTLFYFYAPTLTILQSKSLEKVWDTYNGEQCRGIDTRYPYPIGFKKHCIYD